MDAQNHLQGLQDRSRPSRTGQGPPGASPGHPGAAPRHLVRGFYGDLVGSKEVLSSSSLKEHLFKIALLQGSASLQGAPFRRMLRVGSSASVLKFFTTSGTPSQCRSSAGSSGTTAPSGSGLSSFCITFFTSEAPFKGARFLLEKMFEYKRSDL